MSSFEATLARMRDLYTYGRELNEDNRPTNYAIEYKAKAADGNTYGIIRECSKYYIKKAQKGKENIAESYDYIGGFCNKKNYEYSSYANALKNFELKLASINEACESDLDVSTLDPFKKEDYLFECTDEMKNEIARQRQIMFNAAKIMNESTDFAISRRDDTVMYNGKNPEAETGKRGDEEYTETKANPEYAGSKTNGVDKKATPFEENIPASEDQLKEGCENESSKDEKKICPKCGKEVCVCQEGCENECGTMEGKCTCQENCDGDNTPCNCDAECCNCAADGESCGKPKDPATIGWDIDGQSKVNEENDDDSEMSDVEDDVDLGVDDDIDADDNSDEYSLDSEDDDNDTDSEEDNDVDDEPLSDVSDDDVDFSDDIDDNDEDEIDDDVEDDTDFSDLDYELNSDDDEFGDEDIEFDDETSDADMSNGDDDGLYDEDDFSVEDFGDDEDNLPVDGEDGAEYESEFADDTNEDEYDTLSENRKKTINTVVDSVINKVINEDKLNVFGKHPGYRKKPMELPTTGEDKNQWGEDWNDDSVHSEEPFGTKIGDGKPFNLLVDAITKEIMSRLSEDADKKKVK